MNRFWIFSCKVFNLIAGVAYVEEAPLANAVGTDSVGVSARRVPTHVEEAFSEAAANAYASNSALCVRSRAGLLAAYGLKEQLLVGMQDCVVRERARKRARRADGGAMVSGDGLELEEGLALW